MVFWLYETHGSVDRTPPASHFSQTPPLLNIYTLNRSYIMLEMKALAEAYQGDFSCQASYRKILVATGKIVWHANTGYLRYSEGLTAHSSRLFAVQPCRVLFCLLEHESLQIEAAINITFSLNQNMVPEKSVVAYWGEKRWSLATQGWR